VWKASYFWSFPYYLLGASLVTSINWISRWTDWEAGLLLIPVTLVLFRSYRNYMERMEAQKRHAEEVAALHLRTIEALALAIEAKDHVTHDHVRRVQVYAMELGRELQLSESELSALQAAAVLHDIGKLAVPEHIISKPGRLTPEEFEKMKIHPVVGAEILERVRFPYPVAPIVRAHHEKWDGTGYPAGLHGEEIPIGARILSAVDCLDALASDRQYRRAYPLDEAMAMVSAESGKSFDPTVIEVLKRRYVELESKARASQSSETEKLPSEVVVERGAAPDAGFEESGDAQPGAGSGKDFLLSIAAARHEAQTLFEVAQQLGNSLSLPETLSMLAVRLRALIAFDALAIYVEREMKLIPEFVIGEDRTLFSSLEIPWGQGLTGWVAENRKAIINGNPSVEPGYLNDPTRFSKLNSALAVPLEDESGVVGVMTLYRLERNAFTRDHLRILQAIASKVAVAVRNSLLYREATASAATDGVTGLPNARSLFQHLDAELARCRRNQEPLTAVVVGLNGFKQVNEELGQATGNRVLGEVAKALGACCREYDYVARMGGDDFVMVLAGVDAGVLPSTLRRIERAVERAGIETVGESAIQVSIGHAEFGRDGETVEDLLVEADRRMYANKHRPRLVARALLAS